MEAEDGKLDFESSEDTEVELLLHRRGVDERGPGGTGLIWEPLNGAQPKWNRAGRPSGVPEEFRGLEAGATGGKTGQDVAGAWGSGSTGAIASAEVAGGRRGDATEEGVSGTWGPLGSWVSVASERDTSGSPDFYGSSE